MSTDDILTQLGLTEYIPLFSKEQIDANTLVLVLYIYIIYHHHHYDPWAESLYTVSNEHFTTCLHFCCGCHVHWISFVLFSMAIRQILLFFWFGTGFRQLFDVNKVLQMKANQKLFTIFAICILVLGVDILYYIYKYIYI